MQQNKVSHKSQSFLSKLKSKMKSKIKLVFNVSIGRMSVIIYMVMVSEGDEENRKEKMAVKIVSNAVFLLHTREF